MKNNVKAIKGILLISIFSLVVFIFFNFIFSLGVPSLYDKTAHAEEDINEQIEVIHSESLSNDEEQQITYSTDDASTASPIQLVWIDNNNNEHPLAYTKVKLSTGSIDYTDSNGYLPMGMLANVTSTFDLTIYSAGVRTSVGRAANVVYINIHYNLSVVQQKIIVNVSTLFGKVSQISQALIFADMFAKEMNGTAMDSVKALYPYDIGTNYDDNEEIIYLLGTNTDDEYADWDVIMHEYGHHVQAQLGITDNPGDWHVGSLNMIDHYMLDSYPNLGNNNCGGKCARHRSNYPIDKEDAKEEGIKIAWAEAWPTIFGELAQQYYANELSNIVGVADGKYSDYESVPEVDVGYYYENISRKKGEGCERSVIAVLWELFQVFINNDIASAEAEKVSVNIKKWWDITTISQTYTLSDFIANFYEQYPEYIGDIGYALEEYNIAATIYMEEGTNIVELNTTMTSFDIKYSIDTSVMTYYKPDKFYVTVFSEDYSEHYTSPLLTSDTYTVSSITFAMVKTFVGETVHIAFRTIQSGASPGYSNVAQGVFTGPYYSHVIDVPKRIFTTSVSNDKVTITGTYCDIVGNMTIPEKIDGKTVTAIGDNAFSDQVNLKCVYFEDYSTDMSIGHSAFAYCEELTLIRIPDNVAEIKDSTFTGCGGMIWTYSGGSMTRIGNFAFYETKLPALNTIASSVTTIGQGAFYNSGLIESFHLPENSQLTTLGKWAFSDNGELKSLVLSENVTSIGDYCFQNCDNLTIYTEHSSKKPGWSNSWNSSNRPVVWGCTLSIDKSYVVSFTKSASNPSNATATNGITEPFRFGYTFGGWYTTDDFSGTKYDDILSAPNGILYAKWTEKSCVAEGTLITLANGSQVAVEDLTGNEQLLVWNMLTGEFDTAPILFIDSDSVMQYEIIELTFSDGTQVKVIDEHAFFDINLNKYVFLREDAYQYIGHYFNKQGYDGDGNMIWTTVQLVDVDIYTETTTAWSPVTYGHLCYYVNGMLSMPGATQGFINIFEVDTETMRYDMTAYNNDINTYGLFTYEEFCLEVIEIPEVIFNAFNGQYLKVAMGKNLIDEEGIMQLVERYSEFF